MMTANQTTRIRKQIARSYCRDVVWIDDEIRPSAEASAREPFLTFFQPIANQFAKQEIICHLKEFPQMEGEAEADPYSSPEEIDVCERLALKADVVVLDWHLGNQTPHFSANMIRRIARAGGSRFIVILSQSNQLEEEFRSEFDTEFVEQSANCYRSGDGVFALLLTKSEFSGGDGASRLVDAIFGQMALTYPDYLHWAAIEIAARIKAYSPRWLSSLPGDTDLAVLSENLHSKEGISETIIENLLEDLGEALDFLSIESIQRNALRCEDWPKGESFKEQLQADIAVAEQGLIDNIKKVVPLAISSQAPLDANARGVITKVLKKEAEYKSLSLFGNSIKALGEFCETRSTSNNLSVMRGSILREVGPNTDKILVCVSQSCDCLWESNLLFMVAGSVSDGYDGKSGETFFRFKGTTYLVSPTAANLRVLEKNGGDGIPHGYEILGRLREAALCRIIGRFWGQATRVGINQPRFTRETRSERP